MAIIGEPFDFELEAPSVQEIHELAEELGGLSIQFLSKYHGADLEFEFFPGVVSVARTSSGIFLRSNTGEAPVLFDLLGLTLEKLGGKGPGRDALAEIQLPLTKEIVTNRTTEYRREIRKAMGRIWLMALGILAAGLGVIGLIIWAVRFWLFAS